MHPIDLSSKMERALPNEKKFKTPAPFEQKKTYEEEESPLQEEIVDTLKELLARQKNMELPLSTAPTPQVAPATASTSVSWQPSTQVIQLFEKMVDQLSYLHTNGIQTTTVTLGGSDFSSSIFKGCTLTITEYSTAPKIFNIQFAMTPQAASYFTPHAQQLQNALKQGKWDFSVERLDVEMLDSREKREQQEEHTHG